MYRRSRGKQTAATHRDVRRKIFSLLPASPFERNLQIFVKREKGRERERERVRQPEIRGRARQDGRRWKETETRDNRQRITRLTQRRCRIRVKVASECAIGGSSNASSRQETPAINFIRRFAPRAFFVDRATPASSWKKFNDECASNVHDSPSCSSDLARFCDRPGRL